MWLKNKFVVLMGEEPGTEVGGSTSFLPDSAGLPSEPADDSTESSVNWADLDAQMDADEAAVEGDEVVEGAEGEIPEPAPEAAPAPAPAAQTPATTPPAVTPPAPTEAAPAAPQVPTEPQPQAAPPAEDYVAWRNNRAKELESTYTISEDDAAALLTEPEKVLPRLMANAHLMVLESAVRATQAMLPVMMQEIQQNTEINTRAKNLFASVNPDLADPQYEAAIMEFGRTYRNVNKTASPEEAARAIGALVRSALGIAPAAAPAVHAPAQAAPAPVPFTPARGGGGMQRVVSLNPYEQMAEELLRDE